jgi:hypothetical protein
LVPDPFDAEIVIAKLQKYKSLGSDQIATQPIQADGEILLSELRKLTHSIWNKEEYLISGRSLSLFQFTKRAKKLTLVIAVISSLYKLFPTNFLLRLNPYIDEIIENHQCGFRCNRSISDYIFCNRHILGKTRKQCNTV